MRSGSQFSYQVVYFLIRKYLRKL